MKIKRKKYMGPRVGWALCIAGKSKSPNTIRNWVKIHLVIVLKSSIWVPNIRKANWANDTNNSINIIPNIPRSGKL